MCAGRAPVHPLALPGLVVAAIELHDGVTASAAALTAFCREGLAAYKVSARFVFRKSTSFRARRRTRCTSRGSGTTRCNDIKRL
jgi:acyl-CoA synthetase (AMP-forming)/AMP-acid ligase II